MVIYANNNSCKRYLVLIDKVGCVKSNGIGKFLVRCTTSRINPHHTNQPAMVIDIHVVDELPIGVLQPYEQLWDGINIAIAKSQMSSSLNEIPTVFRSPS